MPNKDIKIFGLRADLADKTEGLLLPEAVELLRKDMPLIAFGAALDEEVVGAVAGGADGVYFDIISLYVHPAYRRKRIGKALMSEAEELLRDEGLFMRATYTLQNEDNETLAPFLEFFGFEPEEAIHPTYFTAELKDLSLRLRASEAVAYDIRFLSEMDDLKKRVLANECIEGGMPLPEGGFFSADDGISVISLRDNKISGYALSEGILQ